MNVLVIPEDFRKDQYVLKPVIAALMKEAGSPRANVAVCRDPLLGGVSQALRWTRIKEILDRYSWKIDLFLLCVDRDGDENRRETLNNLEIQAKAVLPNDRLLLAENAWQEVEVWLLAGHELPAEWKWQDVRMEVHSKEAFFEPFAEQHGVHDEPDEGRKTLSREAARHYRARIRQRCDELRAMEDRVRQRLNRAP